jgi:hypothetical protein
MVRRVLSCLTASALAVAVSGCIVVGPGWGWSGGWPTHWTEEVTQEFALDPLGLQAIDAKTHNGAISFTGGTEGSTQARVLATKKGGGRTPGDAEDALEAIDVYVKRSATGTVRIGWKWRSGLKRPGWRGHVSFEITGPAGIRVVGETHNGPVLVDQAGGVRVTTHNGRVEIEGAVGDVRAVTHNGPVKIQSTGGTLYAETHNGWIHVGYAGDDITLITHNGEVVADLQNCTMLEGDITTHNGRIEVIVGEATSTNLRCETHNGRIKCDAPLSNIELTRRSLKGTIGAGGGRLHVNTHNGGIRVKTTAG